MTDAYGQMELDFGHVESELEVFMAEGEEPATLELEQKE